MKLEINYTFLEKALELKQITPQELETFEKCHHIARRLEIDAEQGINPSVSTTFETWLEETKIDLVIKRFYQSGARGGHWCAGIEETQYSFNLNDTNAVYSSIQGFGSTPAEATLALIEQVSGRVLHIQSKSSHKEWRQRIPKFERAEHTKLTGKTK
jgi:hypothetical protein